MSRTFRAILLLILSGRVAGTITKFAGSNHPKPGHYTASIMMYEGFLLDLTVNS